MKQEPQNELREKWEELINLQNEAALKRKEINLFRENNTQMRRDLNEKIRTSRNENFIRLNGFGEQLRDDIRVLNEKLNELNQQLRQAMILKDDIKIPQLKREIVALRQTLEVKKVEYTEFRTRFQENRDSLKNAREEMQFFEQELEPYKQRTRVILEEMKAQTEMMKGFRQQLIAAREASNIEEVGIILDSMITLQSTMNDTMQSLLDITIIIRNIIEARLTV